MSVPTHNIIRKGKPAIKRPGKALRDRPSKLQVWNLLFDNEILQENITYTNIK